MKEMLISMNCNFKAYSLFIFVLQGIRGDEGGSGLVGSEGAQVYYVTSTITK
jgi:hypothetical protein